MHSLVRSLIPDPPLNLSRRKLDILWVALFVALAVHTWGNALRDAYAATWIYVALHLQAATFFATRYEARAVTKRPLEIVVTLAALSYFFAFDPVRTSSVPQAMIGDLVTSAGAILAFISTQFLGRSFAVLPALRAVRTSGMYRFIRHPIYMSYMIMEIGIVISHPGLYNLTVAVVGVGLTLWRMQFEERVLKQDEAYIRYMQAVPYRIIPYVY